MRHRLYLVAACAILVSACAMAALPAGSTRAAAKVKNCHATKTCPTTTTTPPVTTTSGVTTTTAATTTTQSTTTTAPPTTTTTGATTTTASTTTTTQPGGSISSPPAAAGYFTLLPVGATLPNDCATRVRRSTWEPRPDNTKRNHTLVDPAAVSASFAARQYDSGWRNWNTMQQRINGQFTGTTDEIFQWAACKWGLPDNVLRGMAVRESTWYQYLTYPSNRCVTNRGCGDFFSATNADVKLYCDHIDTFGYSYQNDYGSGWCPKTFSIVGVMSWYAPSWRSPYPPFAGNQRGTFPFSRDSTAFAVDYLAAHLYGCYQGNITWLNTTGGDLWGCVGSWYAGNWHSADADGYIGRVQTEIANLRWLQPSWPTDKPGCSSTYGCPGPDTL